MLTLNLKLEHCPCKHKNSQDFKMFFYSPLKRNKTSNSRLALLPQVQLVHISNQLISFCWSSLTTHLNHLASKGTRTKWQLRSKQYFPLKKKKSSQRNVLKLYLISITENFMIVLTRSVSDLDERHTFRRYYQFRETQKLRGPKGI